MIRLAVHWRCEARVIENSANDVNLAVWFNNLPNVLNGLSRLLHRESLDESTRDSNVYYRIEIVG